jgi:hypothetical protein
MKNKEIPVTEFGNFSDAEFERVQALYRNLLRATAGSIHDNPMRLDALLYAMANYIAVVFHNNASQQGENTVEPSLCALATLTIDALSHFGHDTGGLGRVIDSYLSHGVSAN